MSSLKSTGSFFKGTFCLAILYFLISSDKLDLQKLSMIYAKPQIFLVYGLTWTLGVLFLNALRWRVLLKIVGVSINTARATSLTAIGLFFSSFLPGSVSGDAIKAFYIVNENKQISKTQVFSTILMDRIIGLYSIFTIASITLLFSFSWAELRTHLSLVLPILTVFLGVTLFFFYLL